MTSSTAESLADSELSALPARLKQARLAAGLSLEELSQRFPNPISKQALSKYERGEAMPAPTRLIELADVLDVNADWLVTPPSVTVSWVAYRARHALTQERRNRVTASAERRLEPEMWLRTVFGASAKHDVPTSIEVETVDAAEQAAAMVRSSWGLGEAPIANVIETLESHGVVVLGFPADPKFDGLSGWTDAEVPVVVVNSAKPTDRVRFDAAHELGHLCFASTATEADQERFAHRFASAFLAPSPAVRREIGESRHALSIAEVGLLKARWGLSMQAWFRRARDLNVIGNDHYVWLNRQFRMRGWHLQEPYDFEGDETPALFRRLIWRALAEGVLTKGEARRILPELEATPEARLVVERPTLRDLVRMPPAERDSLIAALRPEVDMDEVRAWDALGSPSDGER